MVQGYVHSTLLVPLPERSDTEVPVGGLQILVHCGVLNIQMALVTRISAFRRAEVFSL